MPRSRSSSSRSSQSVSTKSAPPPAPSHRAPPPAVQQHQAKGGGMLQGLGSTIMEGFAFGTGSAIARQAVGAVFGGSSTQQQDSHSPAISQSVPPTAQQMERPPDTITQFSNSACQMDQDAFKNCMQENGNTVSSCDFYFQALRQCQAENNSNFSTL